MTFRTGAGRVAATAVIVASTGTVAACAEGGEGSSPAPSPAARSSATLPPPPTEGVMAWGADLHGFGKAEARCFGDDIAIRLMWTRDDYFAACRNAVGSRYLRAWTRSAPRDIRDVDRPRVGVFGEFFTETPNSLQFMADGAKFDLGPTIVTIVWPRQESGRGISTSITTGRGWTRLN